MKRLLAVLAIVALYGCVAHVAQPMPPKTVLVLGNKTTQAACECPDTAAANARADKWKAYAEKLETRLGIPHEGQQP